MKYCSKCGAEIHDEAVVCPYCGCAVPVVKPRRTWGDIVGRIGLPFGIIALVFGLLSLIPLLGLVFWIFDIIFGIIALSFGAVGSIKAVSKGKCITTIVFGAIAFSSALIIYFTVFAAVASATTNGSSSIAVSLL